MFKEGKFKGLEIEKFASQEDFGLLETVTFKQNLSRTTDLNGNSTEKMIVYSISTVSNSGTDGSYTVTLYVKSTFDKITVNAIDYAKIVSSEYKADILDSSFRAKAITGRLGQAGIGAVYANGKPAKGKAYSKDFKVNYPTSKKWYKTTGNADRYFSTQYPDNVIGSWAEVTVERYSTGRTFTFRVNANF